MKSIAVLGMGVIALMAGAFITAGAAPGTSGSYFEASVAGGMSARPAGEVAFGVVGDSGTGVSAFTITLGGAESSGAILLTRLDGRTPVPGRYELSDTTAAGFRAMYIAGSPARPTALYRAKHGTLEITASSAEHISGHFSFIGAGFLAGDPTDEGSEVKVDGAFVSTHAPAARPAQP
jgi:hypothetical protein